MNIFSSKKSLSDVIIGYRRPNTNQKQYLIQTLTHTKQELQTKDFAEKLVAAQKLLFLFNEGVDIQWAIFNIIELMGSNAFENKRISYVIAPLVLKDGRNVEFLTLTPNIFRKDLNDVGDTFTTSIAINCLSRICNEDLA
jgi:AP-3 complex subunit delta-1